VRTGKRKEGAFYGMWTFTSKVGTSLAIFLTGIILGLAKYSPNLATQSDSARMAIRLIVGPIPAVVFIAAMVLVQFYPIDEKAYAALMKESKEHPAD
jgi:GPH family glycoside/pentoside/hexuronide:cation symporter